MLTRGLQFRRLVYSHAWNLLDNNQEQLNLKRSEKFKSAEHTLSVLSKKQVRPATCLVIHLCRSKC